MFRALGQVLCQSLGRLGAWCWPGGHVTRSSQERDGPPTHLLARRDCAVPFCLCNINTDFYTSPLWLLVLSITAFCSPPLSLHREVLTTLPTASAFWASQPPRPHHHSCLPGRSHLEMKVGVEVAATPTLTCFPSLLLPASGFTLALGLMGLCASQASLVRCPQPTSVCPCPLCTAAAGSQGFTARSPPWTCPQGPWNVLLCRVGGEMASPQKRASGEEVPTLSTRNWGPEWGSPESPGLPWWASHSMLRWLSETYWWVLGCLWERTYRDPGGISSPTLPQPEAVLWPCTCVSPPGTSLEKKGIPTGSAAQPLS